MTLSKYRVSCERQRSLMLVACDVERERPKALTGL